MINYIHNLNKSQSNLLKSRNTYLAQEDKNLSFVFGKSHVHSFKHMQARTQTKLLLEGIAY